jgi:hypothetical protein
MQLFGELLNIEARTEMPEGEDWNDIRKKLIEFAPDFSPI